jgi:hypothetical protein
VDGNKTVYVYDPTGALLGSWTAGGMNGNPQVEGLATDGTDVWLLDNFKDKVYRYSGAAGRRAGSQSAASSFSLAGGNSNGKGLVTDGTSLWVVDDGSTDKVYRYAVSGTAQGSWGIDAANTSPTGLTLNPTSPSDLWIVDSGTKKVYQYTAAAGRTSGSQNAVASFALAATNTNPQDIADPPVDLPPAAAAAPLALNTPTVVTPGAPSSVGAPPSAPVPSLAQRDTLFARLGRESFRAPREPALALTAGEVLLLGPDRSPFAADGAAAPAPASAGPLARDVSTVLPADSTPVVGIERSAVGLVDEPVVAAESPASPAVSDALFALLAEDVLASK